MKKWWCLLLAVLLAFSLAACSARTSETTTEEPQTAGAETSGYSGLQMAKPNPEDTFAATYQIVRIETVTGEGSADEATITKWKGFSKRQQEQCALLLKSTSVVAAQSRQQKAS